MRSLPLTTFLESSYQLLTKDTLATGSGADIATGVGDEISVKQLKYLVLSCLLSLANLSSAAPGRKSLPGSGLSWRF